ncbi:MAG TPA: cell envelope integrity protein TolA [Candidatus Tumulicola sp.]
MISEAGDRRSGRFLLWGLALSLAVHALLVVLTSWLWFAKLPLFAPKAAPRESIVASTAVRIERRPVPQPRSQSAPNPAPPSVPQPIPRPATRAAPPAARRPELARQNPRARPQPTRQPAAPDRPSSLQRQIAAQQQTFSQEIARLRAGNNPLSLAVKPREAPAAYRRTYFDVPGHRDFDAQQVQLVPLRHWYDAGAICYYTRYLAQYTHGGNETGTIPWPVCYPIGEDRIANPPYVHDVPIPFPPRDYVLPAGTYLTPLLANIYRQRPVR